MRHTGTAVAYPFDAASAGFVVRSAAARSGATCWGAGHPGCLEAVVGADVAAATVVSVAANWTAAGETAAELSCARTLVAAVVLAALASGLYSVGTVAALVVAETIGESELMRSVVP